MCFGYIIGSMSSLIANLDKQAAMLKQITRDVNNYMALVAVPKKSCVRVRKYLKFYYGMKTLFQVRPPSLSVCLSLFALYSQLTAISSCRRTQW